MNKKIFKLEDYPLSFPKHDFVMWCKTEEEAKVFCNFLDMNNRVWCSGESYRRTTEWRRFKENTIYLFNRDMFSELPVRLGNMDITVLNFSDFFFEDNASFDLNDLEDFDFIVTRNGAVGCFNKKYNSLLYHNGCSDFREYDADLTPKEKNSNSKYWDIMYIYRADQSYQVNFNHYKEGTLLYQRRIVEKMTLKEVCEELGREVEIVED